MKRVVIPELLDTDAGTPAEISAALSDLRHINQWFGGIAATQSMIAQVGRRLALARCRCSKSRPVLDMCRRRLVNECRSWESRFRSLSSIAPIPI